MRKENDMKCEKCIHNEACDLNRRLSGNTNSLMYEEDCRLFKDKARYIELPCKAGDVVYVIFRGVVTQGTVRLIRPFVSEQETIFKGNLICEVDNLFIDDGTKEEVELYVVFEKPYGIERVAYLTREEAEKALAERSRQ